MSALSFGVGWNERLFDKCVEMTQVDIRQDWPDNGALWGTAECAVPFPLFEISRLEQLTDESEEASIVDVFCQGLKQDGMIQTLEAGRYIAVG